MAAATRKSFLYTFAAVLLVTSFFISMFSFSVAPVKLGSPDVLVGVDATFGAVEDMKTIIDEVKSYTNFFVVGSTAMTNDLANITQVGNYLHGSGLKFLTYAHPAQGLNFSQVQWLRDARQQWNSSFMGLYAYDEPGGHQMDHDYAYMCAKEAANNSDAAAQYVGNLTAYLGGVTIGWEIGDFPVFTSDYALYEYDYRAGYDVILAELAWNNSGPLNLALDRGAATVHNKEWGAMITGSYNDSRYTFTAQEMYDNMVLAYENGAKYILVFDYPSLSAGILKQEHFDALKQFWQYAQTHPRTGNPGNGRVAFVLPKDYGYGFRGEADKIWGLWETDGSSAKIWNDANALVGLYGSKLDIIYEDTLQLNVTAYSRLIFWNGTELTP